MQPTYGTTPPVTLDQYSPRRACGSDPARGCPKEAAPRVSPSRPQESRSLMGIGRAKESGAGARPEL